MMAGASDCAESSDWAGVRVAVLGLGVTGFSLADTLNDLGALVSVITAHQDPKRQDVLDVIGVETLIARDGVTEAELLTRVDPAVVFTSPGYRPDHPALRWVSERELPLLTDVDLAWRMLQLTDAPPKWLCVTGTNGKTTTVQLTTEMVAAGGLTVAYCGNIGTPILDVVRQSVTFDVLVVELSSFQLHYLSEISPWASVCLNVAEDHLDWHGSLSRYVSDKAKVYEHTLVACLYNRHDSVTETMVREADVVEGARAVGFGLTPPGPSDLGVVDGVLCDRAFHVNRANEANALSDLSELSRVGLAADHLVLDVLAAAGLARSVGVSAENISRAIAAFSTDHHRIEPIAVVNEVLWVDDSKATNAHAADASLSAFDSVVWVVGGLLKGVDCGALVAKHADRLRAAVVIGQDRGSLMDAFERHASHVPVVEISNPQTGMVMNEAVSVAAQLAQPSDTVLLAPAAASMDQFESYADRGEQFAAAVRSLAQGGLSREKTSITDD